MAEPCCTTFAALGTVAATSAASSAGGKVGEYMGEKIVEAADDGWKRDHAAGGISSWGNKPSSSPATA